MNFTLKDKPGVLICDDDVIFQVNIKHALKDHYQCYSAKNGDEALAVIATQPIAVVLLDIQMRTPDEGLMFLPRILELNPELSVVVSSLRNDFQTIQKSIRLGAVDYLLKDSPSEDLIHALNRVFERRSLIRTQHRQNQEMTRIQNQHVLIGESAPITELRKIIRKVRMSSANVLITGETGTGKEIVARQLRRTQENGVFEPFIAVNSATIQASTAESSLFGHEKGAFTGADKTSKGIFEDADGGSVYFDEISNMPLEIQAKLLRVLQEKEISRLGSSKVIQLDFRVICATNFNLEEMVRLGTFKADLYQRLNVIPIEIPPLRERKSDVPLLVRHFAARQPIGRPEILVTDEAMEIFLKYDWPGNVRELSNVIAYLTAMNHSNVIQASDLPLKFLKRVKEHQLSDSPQGKPHGGQDSLCEMNPAVSKSFYDRVAVFEKQLLVREYQFCEGNISKMAASLEMDRSYLYTKLKTFGIHKSHR